METVAQPVVNRRQASTWSLSLVYPRQSSVSVALGCKRALDPPYQLYPACRAYVARQTRYLTTAAHAGDARNFEQELAGPKRFDRQGGYVRGSCVHVLNAAIH